jgi:hypothetical protein
MTRYYYPVQYLVILLLSLLLRISFAQDSDIGEVNEFPDLYEASVEELQRGLEAGSFTSVDLVKVRGAIAYSPFSKIHTGRRTGVSCTDR